MILMLLRWGEPSTRTSSIENERPASRRALVCGRSQLAMRPGRVRRRMLRPYDRLAFPARAEHDARHVHHRHRSPSGSRAHRRESDARPTGRSLGGGPASGLLIRSHALRSRCLAVGLAPCASPVKILEAMIATFVMIMSGLQRWELPPRLSRVLPGHLRLRWVATFT